MRNPDCTFYDECLTQAALMNGPLVCDHCQRFKRWPEGSEEADLDGIFDLLKAVFSPEAVPG